VFTACLRQSVCAGSICCGWLEAGWQAGAEASATYKVEVAVCEGEEPEG